jgi:YD repeat-containing protein
MAYDHHGQQLSIENADGTSLEWKRDWFGTIIEHKDLGGRTHDYAYDYKQQLLHHSTHGGQQRQHIKINNLTYDNNIVPFWCGATYFNDVPTSDIHYTYQFGRTMEEHDAGLERTTTKQYDPENRIEQVQIKATDGRILRTILTKYDALGREESTSDEHCSTVIAPITAKVIKNMAYDAANNRRHEEYRLRPLRYNDRCEEQEHHRDVWSNGAKLIRSNLMLPPDRDTNDVLFAFAEKLLACA